VDRVNHIPKVSQTADAVCAVSNDLSAQRCNQKQTAPAKPFSFGTFPDCSGFHCKFGHTVPLEAQMIPTKMKPALDGT
jgi:hypothetical protein